MKNQIFSDGDYIEITAGATIASGDLVQFGNLHGVAVTDIANGAKGNIALKGIYTFPKLTAAAGDAWYAGAGGYHHRLQDSVGLPDQAFAGGA